MTILTIKPTDDNWSYEQVHKSEHGTIGLLELDMDQFKIDTNQLTAVSPYSIQPLTTAQITQISTINTKTVSSYDMHRYSTLKLVKYIIAGNQEEYKDYISKKGYSSDEYVYVYDPEIFQGKSNVHGYYIGSWKYREDIKEIKNAIGNCNLNGY